jgi:hypothetical protein
MPLRLARDRAEFSALAGEPHFMNEKIAPHS